MPPRYSGPAGRWTRLHRIARAVVMLVLAGSTPATYLASFASPVDILILAPHPDDDTITAAGVTQRARAKGQSVKIVYMTNGDHNGIAVGYQREGEVVDAAIDHLGLLEQDLIFLGYPDGYLQEIDLNHTGAGDQLTTPWGQSVTYGNRGLGGSDYHTYRFGSPAPYNRPNILTDLEDILATSKPKHIFVTSEWDQHPDHSTTYSLLSSALAAVFDDDPTYAPTVHKTIVWADAPGEPRVWPEPLDPTTYHVAPPNLPETNLAWVARESIDVPLPMQSTIFGSNPKYQAIEDHASQGGIGGFLGQFLHKDEFFWVENPAGSNRPPQVSAGFGQAVSEGALVQLDGSGSSDPDGTTLDYTWTQTAGMSATLSDPASPIPTFVAPSGLSEDEILTFELTVDDGEFTSIPDSVTVIVHATSPNIPPTNIAPLATVSASTENPAEGQQAIKAVDGVVDGWPGDYTREWATQGERAGAWIQLDWSRPYSVDRIVLYDRPNPDDQVLSATLTFSDASTVTIGTLGNGGAGNEYPFPPRGITSVTLMVTATSGSTQNVGLAEFEVFRTPSVDADLDDWTVADGDCNDADPAIYPTASDASCNGIDENCTGTADEEYVSQPTSCGVGACAGTGSTSCVSGQVVDSCAPGTPTSEVCDGIDNDCNGVVDDGLLLTWYADADGDSYGNEAVSQQACAGPAGYVGIGGDCNDADGAIHPGAADASCDGVDQNCSGAADEGYVSQATGCGDGACASTGSTSCVSGQVVDSCAPGTPTSEVCDGIDNDCNGTVDNGVLLTWYADADQDTYGSDAVSQQACAAPAGYVGIGGDCNDADGAIHPGGSDGSCDGVDQNCSGAADEGYVSQATACGVGACAATGSTSCVSGQVVDSCAPGTPTSEVCDGIDNDCNGTVDNGVLLTWYADADQDTYGNDAVSQQACAAPAGYVGADGDCNDADGSIHPGVADASCDGVDQNCSGAADEGYVSQATGCGVGACSATGSTSCVSGQVVDSCAPGTPTSEVCDGIDNDCNGIVDDATVPIGSPTLTVDKTQLSWTPVANATAYDVVRGNLQELRSSGGNFTVSTKECLANDLASTSFNYNSGAAGDSWFLVRPVSCGGAGTYNETSGSQAGDRDAEIAASSVACP